MNTTASCDHTDQLQTANPPSGFIQKTNNRKKPFLIFFSICLVCFLAPFQHSESKQLNSPGIDPEDMTQNGYYFFTDHGSGVQVIQFDRMESSTIYSFSSIRPSTQTYHGPGLWGPTVNTGNIRLANNAEVTHLLACVFAGTYVP